MLPDNPVIQILVVDDHEIVRMGLATVFANYADLELIGEAANGQEAVDFCARLQPDVILMDLSMPVMDGVTATRIICQAYPPIKVLIFSNSGGFERIQTAIDAGATGYMRKNVSSAEMVVVIRAAVFSDN
jgi:two-component system, NarL family, response regulator LiaR